MSHDKKEWDYAKRYFLMHPYATQLNVEKKSTKIDHHFIKVKGEIYSISKGEPLGVGGFGIVKLCKDEKGRSYAVKEEGVQDLKLKKEQLAKKLEGLSIEDIKEQLDEEKEEHKRRRRQNKSEYKINKKMGQTQGQIKSKVKKRSTFRTDENSAPIVIKAKTLTIITFYEGGGLDKKLDYINKQNNYSDSQKEEIKLNLALQAAQKIRYCHEKRILHKDIKAENFMLHSQDLTQKDNVVTIDYGLSKKLKKGTTQFTLIDAKGFPLYEGTNGYMSPEIMKNGMYSYASDVYAFGHMLEKEFKFTDNENIIALIHAMKKTKLEERPTMEEVIKKLQYEINLRHDPDLKAKDTISKLINPLMNNLLDNREANQSKIDRFEKIKNANVNDVYFLIISKNTLSEDIKKLELQTKLTLQDPRNTQAQNLALEQLLHTLESIMNNSQEGKSLNTIQIPYHKDELKYLSKLIHTHSIGIAHANQPNHEVKLEIIKKFNLYAKSTSSDPKKLEIVKENMNNLLRELQKKSSAFSTDQPTSIEKKLLIDLTESNSLFSTIAMPLNFLNLNSAQNTKTSSQHLDWHTTEKIYYEIESLKDNLKNIDRNQLTPETKTALIHFEKSIEGLPSKKNEFMADFSSEPKPLPAAPKANLEQQTLSPIDQTKITPEINSEKNKKADILMMFNHLTKQTNQTYQKIKNETHIHTGNKFKKKS